MKVKPALLFLPLLLLLSGCPQGTKYSLCLPSEPVDKALLGTWTTEAESPEFKKVIISRRDDYSYRVEVFDTAAPYSLDVTQFIARITKLGDYRFIEAQPLGSSRDSSYYLYCFELLNKKNARTFDVVLAGHGMHHVTSTETYREEVLESSQAKGFLIQEKVWKKK
jgi:hypothetical protein